MPGGHTVIHGEEKVERVEPGMAPAIGSCGIEFGVRMVDTVRVSEPGPVTLTTAPKGVVA